MEEHKNTMTLAATPAPVIAPTPETTNTATANAVQPGAETNKAIETVTAETKGEATPKQDPRYELPKGVKREIWELRETVRSLKAAQQAQANAPLAAPTASTTVQAEEVSLLDDPEKWARLNEQKVTASATANAKKEILAEMEQTRETERLTRENNEGIEYLLSKPEVANDPEVRAEIAEMLQRPYLAHMAAKYPVKAAQFAYSEFISAKGVGAERKTTVAANVAAGASIPSAASQLGKKVWTRADIETALSDFSNPKYAEIEAEISTAINEGRVK